MSDRDFRTEDPDVRPPRISRRRILQLGTSALLANAMSPLDRVFAAEAAGDPELPENDHERWFLAEGAGGWPVRDGNDVIGLIDGFVTFGEMITVIRSANAANHYIYLLGWWLTDSFFMNNQGGSRMSDLLLAASNAGVEIRAMLWSALRGQNAAEVANIKALATGSAILDNRTRANPTTGIKVGSHHQKILIVKGTQGLIALCGGVDINPDRRYPKGNDANRGGDTAGAPLHDVHCRVRGPSAWDLLQVFVERWNEHPDVAALPAVKRGLRGAAEAVPAAIAGQVVRCQVGRTYPKGVYGFVPAAGTQQAAAMIVKAIGAARKFIYVEDQYFVDTVPSPSGHNVRTALIEARAAVQHITVLIPDDLITDLTGKAAWNQAGFRRRELINAVRVNGNNTKLRVYFRKNTNVAADHPDRHEYVHSKTWIFDDEYAIIGSANCNRRSWTHDSEVVMGIWDRGKADRSRLWLAHDLRMRLWSHHLGIDKMADLKNGVESRKYWDEARKPSAAVRQYDYRAVIGPNLAEQTLWDELIDPFGS